MPSNLYCVRVLRALIVLRCPGQHHLGPPRTHTGRRLHQAGPSDPASVAQRVFLPLVLFPSAVWAAQDRLYTWPVTSLLPEALWNVIGAVGIIHHPTHFFAVLVCSRYKTENSGYNFF